MFKQLDSIQMFMSEQLEYVQMFRSEQLDYVRPLRDRTVAISEQKMVAMMDENQPKCMKKPYHCL